MSNTRRPRKPSGKPFSERTVFVGDPVWEDDFGMGAESIHLLLHQRRAAEARQAVLVPDTHVLAWRRLSEDQRELLLDLQTDVRAQLELAESIRDRVEEARREGISWDNIGVALGTSGRGASKRYGEAIDAP